VGVCCEFFAFHLVNFDLTDVLKDGWRYALGYRG
jgi:hypothetical protein